MGTEMKSPENSETSVRNRKKKEITTEKCEKSAKVTSKEAEIDDVTKPERPDLKMDEQIRASSFKLRLEFDPMSIALFTLAVATRFFRLSEPRNVV